MNKSNSAAHGAITSGISPDTQITKTLEFVLQQLPDWRDDRSRPPEIIENRLNSQLSKFLTAKARTQFPSIQFEHETYQTGKHSVDMSASFSEQAFIGARSFSIYEPFLVFECKRLTTAIPANRKREYVTGEYPNKISGGIQRFKLGLHGKDHTIAAMIGYIQNETVQHWHLAINSWIVDLSGEKSKYTCSWCPAEQLQTVDFKPKTMVASCKSKHSRKGEVVTEEIELHHLWVAMNW